MHWLRLVPGYGTLTITPEDADALLNELPVRGTPGMPAIARLRELLTVGREEFVRGHERYGNRRG